MTGIFFALSAAAFWALATRLFARMSGFWTPAALAFIKSLVSLVLFGLWFAVAAKPVFDQDLQTIGFLVLSGVIGIAIGDTALFMALYRMGERRTLLIAETAAPVMVFISALVLLGEHIALLQLTGIVLVILGVDWVIGFSRGGGDYDASGVTWALVAALCQTIGVIVSRFYLQATDIEAEATALWRILGACLALPFWLLLRGESLKPAARPDMAVLVRLLVGIFLGTFLGILFLQISIDLLPASIAQTLIATSILFALIFAALRGEPVPIKQWLGVVVAIAGVAAISMQPT
jgi:drug/metabolite transporter (DMT)-like permease